VKARVLIISTAEMELKEKLCRLPDRGESIVEEEFTFTVEPGGHGIYSALTFARMGLDPVFCSRIGPDGNGRGILRLLEKEGVDARFVTVDKSRQSGFSSVRRDLSGDSRTVVYPGAIRSLSPEDVEDAMTCLPDAVYIGLGIPEKTALAAARYAGMAGLPLYVDGGPAREDFPLDKLGKVEIFSPSETETFFYTGIRPVNTDNCLRAAIRLSSMVDARFIVLKLGSRGCYVYDGKFFHVIPAPSVDAVDPSGAGAVFTAALTALSMEKKGLVDASRFATYAASLSTRKEGASASVPGKAEVLSFISGAED